MVVARVAMVAAMGMTTTGTSSKSEARGCITEVGHDRMTMSDGDEARVYAANNVSTDATTEQFVRTRADLRGRWGARVLLGSLESLVGG